MSTQIQAPLDGVPRYTTWAAVPDGQYTRTQLRQRIPSLVPKPDAQPVGQVLYHGNNYAPLYRLEDAAQRRLASPAQVANAARARELQLVCRWCGYRDEEPLGRGRLCGDCWPAVDAYRKHRAAAGSHVPFVTRLLRGEPLVGVVVAARLATGPAGQDLPVHLAVLDAADGRLLLDTTADPFAATGPTAYPAVLTRMDEVLRDAGTVEVTAGYQHTRMLQWRRLPLHRLVNPGPRGDDFEACWAGTDAYPWMRGGCEFGNYYLCWYGKPHPHMAPGFYQPDYRMEQPGASGDPRDDAVGLLDLVRQVAAGTAPVHPDAPWLAAHIPVEDLRRMAAAR